VCHTRSGGPRCVSTTRPTKSVTTTTTARIPARFSHQNIPAFIQASSYASALALSFANSSWVMVPASSNVLAAEICSAGDLPATSRM